MKNYEITFITKEDAKEKPIKAILENLGGKITNISSLGQKTFTYPIKKEKSGFYTTVNFEIEPEKVVDLNKKLGLEEEISRFLIISVKPMAETVAVATEVKKTEIIPEPEKEIVPVPEEEKPEKVVKPKEKAKPVQKPQKVSKKVKELIVSLAEPVSEEERMEALDKKLEELLKE